MCIYHLSDSYCMPLPSVSSFIVVEYADVGLHVRLLHFNEVCDDTLSL
jgi:hypothetical protein